MKKVLPFFLIFGIVFVFFWQFLFKGFLPIPSDTIVGLYYPFREVYFKTNPGGVPYKNFLITDSVRQQIPWREMVISAEKKFTLPLWNPYNFSGTPLLANIQSAPFYPFNLLFFLFPFSISWSILILLQPLLSGIFLYIYLNNLKLKKEASLFGAIVFSFCGFSIAWLEWGTIIHTALWLPLILLSIDKIILNVKPKTSNFKKIIWPLIFIFALSSSFFAGHLQIFFYGFLFTIVYFVTRWLNNGRKTKILLLFIILNSIFLILVLPQLVPTIKLIALSTRNFNSIDWQTYQGWFIPWQNLIQFIAPDFFGNPATLNYFGTWNYGEFIGYVGIGSLAFAAFSLFRKDRKTLFFTVLLIASLIFSLPTVFARIPFLLNLPFLSTSQPTRLIFIIDFCLSVLAALGLDLILKQEKKTKMLHVLVLFSLIFVLTWVSALFIFNKTLGIFYSVTRQNLILPTILFIVNSILIIFLIFSGKKYVKIITGLVILVLVFDLFRFGWKFESFTPKNYFYPSNSITNFLQAKTGVYRVMSNNMEILPPNFSIMYKLQTLDGYDSLYPLKYAEFIAASQRGKPDITPPFVFGRIPTFQDPSTKIADFLGIKYILSLHVISDPKLKLVFTDGAVYIYENSNVFPRAFFVKNTILVNSKQKAITSFFELINELRTKAVVEAGQVGKQFKNNWSVGTVKINDYQDDKIILETTNQEVGFMVLTDSFYPTWHATIDGKETKIYLTDYNFRGIIVPKGVHNVVFYITPF